MTLRLRMRILSVITLPLFSVAIIPSLAQQVNCANPQTTLEMNICAGRAYQTADRKLNQVYKTLQSKLKVQQRQRLSNAQLAWIKFRDATCNYERGQFEGGTAAGPVGGSCLARVTEQRVKDLEGYLQDTNR